MVERIAAGKAKREGVFKRPKERVDAGVGIKALPATGVSRADY